jgi:hypothetical protein
LVFFLFLQVVAGAVAVMMLLAEMSVQLEI